MPGVHPGCCACPELHRAWVPFKPFGRFIYCATCRELTDDMTWAERFVWEHFVSYLWNGRVEVEGREL